MSEHTPTPYMVMTITGTGLPVIVAECGPCIAEITKWTDAGKSDPDAIIENAEFIVKACNAYEADQKLIGELVRALKAMHKVFNLPDPFFDSDSPFDRDNYFDARLAIDMTIEALATAKEVGR